MLARWANSPLSARRCRRISTRPPRRSRSHSSRATGMTIKFGCRASRRSFSSLKCTIAKGVYLALACSPKNLSGTLSFFPSFSVFRFLVSCMILFCRKLCAAAMFSNVVSVVTEVAGDIQIQCTICRRCPLVSNYEILRKFTKFRPAVLLRT